MKKIILLCFAIIVIISCQTNNVNKSDTLEYRIIEKQDISFANTSRMVYRVILQIDSIPSDNQMKSTALSIWENTSKQWNELTLFIYLPDMNTGYSAYGIGVFNENELVSFQKNDGALMGTRWEQKKKD